MSKMEALQRKARAMEQRERWRDAVELYRQSVAATPAREVDPALWNRIGDLHLRLGQAGPAVEAYHYAAVSYEQAGLFDNASAVGRKILRAMPGRSDAHRLLARIAAHQGFVTDARENFAQYAEQINREGHAESVREALDELAATAPNNPEIHRTIEELRSSYLLNANSAK